MNINSKKEIRNEANEVSYTPSQNPEELLTGPVDMKLWPYEVKIIRMLRETVAETGLCGWSISEHIEAEFARILEQKTLILSGE